MNHSITRLSRIPWFSIQTNLKLQLHTDILSLQEIQRTINQTIQTKEQQFNEQIKKGFINYQLWKQIKNQYLHPSEAIEIIKSLNSIKKQTINEDTTQPIIINESDRKNEILKDDVYNYFIKYFSKKHEKLTFAQIAVVMENYAFARRFDQQFFRLMENEIYERLDDPDEVVTYHDIEKILWAYQYCSYGSAVLYDRLAKMLKYAQHEINPLKLSYYAYLYSKCKENVNGGFGMYALAETKVLERINDYDFKDLVKIAKYFFTPNIGSNNFQTQIEERLTELFPNQNELKPSELVRLCKATSRFYFKYNDKALYHKIESACLEMIDKVNDKQFSEITWSFIRSRKGNHLIHEQFVKQLKIRRKMLTFRQLTILFLNSSQHIESYQLTQILSEIIQYKVKEEEIKIKPIYLAYTIISSLKAQLPYDIEMTDTQINQLSTTTKLVLLSNLTQCLPQMKQIILAQRLINNLQTLDLDNQELLQLVYSEDLFLQYVSKSKKQPEITQDIHKQQFHQALFLDSSNENLHNALLMLLQSHGDQMRFCFRQDNWVVISWCILSEHLFNKERLINESILQQACIGILEIDINTITNIEKYIQCVWMVILVKKYKVNLGLKKLLKLQNNQLQQYIKSIAILNNKTDTILINIKQSLIDSLSTQLINLQTDKVQFQQQSFINMFDYKNLILLPVGAQIQSEQQLLQFGIILINNQEVSNEDNILGRLGIQEQQLIDKLPKKYRVQQLILEELFNWNTRFIHLEEFNKLNQEEQIKYLNNLFKLEELPQETDEELRIQKKQKKNLSFKEKLDSSKKPQYENDEMLNIEL